MSKCPLTHRMLKVTLICLMLSLGACGQKGPLVPPPPPGEQTAP